MKSTILCKSIIYYQVLKVESRKLKKNYRKMTASTWKIKLEIAAYLLIKFLYLFTSEFEYLVIKVSRKRFWFCVLFLDGTSSKIKRGCKLFRKRCQNFASRILSRWLYKYTTRSGLLMNKTKKATATKNSHNF